MEQELRQKISKYLLLFALLLGFCVSCGQMRRDIGFGPPEREIEKMYGSAEATYNRLLEGKIRNSRRNWNNVIQQFSKIAKNHPKSRFADDAQYKTGLCYVQAYGLFNNSQDKAAEAFERLIKRYPDSEFVDDACYWRACAYFLGGDYECAKKEYKEFARKYPQDERREESFRQIEECRARLGEQIETPPQIPDHTPVVIEKPDESRPDTPDQPPDSPAEAPPETASSHITDIRFHSSSEFTRVVVDLSSPVEYKTGKLEDPVRFYVNLQTAAIDPAKQTIPVNDKFIKGIRAAQFDENTVRIVLDVEANRNCNVFYLTEPDRIVIDVSSRSDAPPPDQSESVPLVKQLGLKIKTIVLDPGHGGKDPGAVSKSGLQEKRVVLDVAKRLKSLLESDGSYQIYLTRETDVFIPLEERTAFANEKGADVFISIHINAHKNQTARGVETYYLSLASDEEARMTAALENASSEKTMKDLNNIVRYILRGTKVKESRELARTVQSQLSQNAETNDRGIKRAPFIVLIGAEAPSILVELGFISNKHDERLLRNEEYRNKLARALMEAVKNYIKTIDQAS